MCQRGSLTCPGKGPLDVKTQCKSHRIQARVQAKIAAARGTKNILDRMEDKISPRFSQVKCRKECCLMVCPQQVTK